MHEADRSAAFHAVQQHIGLGGQSVKVLVPFPPLETAERFALGWLGLEHRGGIVREEHADAKTGDSPREIRNGVPSL